MKKVKFLNLLLLILCLFLLTSCTKEPITPTYTVYYMMNELTLKTETVQENEKAPYYEPEYKENSIFDDWYTDDTYTSKYDFDALITCDTYIYVHYLTGYYKVSFITNSNDAIEDQYVYRRTKITLPENPTKQNYTFVGWYTDSTLLTAFDPDTSINSNLTLYAKYQLDYSKASTINYVLPEDVFLNKEHLFRSFIGDFYYFLLNNTSCNLSDIESVEDFYTLFKTWEKNGRSDLYHIGDRFQKYFVSFDEDGKVEDQPTDTFIGYLWQQGKYHEFINHLITFFEYWRTDEGYSQTDIHGNDFFYSSWASLVDTAKFFYFTSANLHTKYAWFNSKRVKNALDNIPGVAKLEDLPTILADTYVLPELSSPGFIFNGYYIDSDYTISITEISLELLMSSENITIYVDFQLAG